MSLTIRPAARRDILDMYARYLNLELPEVAERWIAAVAETLEAITQRPEAGSPRPFDNPLLIGLRVWPLKGFKNLRVYYRSAQDMVLVVRILHDRRDVAAILDNAPDDSEDIPEQS